MEENFDIIKQRLLLFLEKQKIKKYDFYQKVDLSPSNFGGKGLQSSLSAVKISEILNIFPELNPDWLLLEKGEMLRKNESESVISGMVPEKIFRELLEKNAELNREIGRLEAELESAKKAAVAPAAESAGCAAAV